MAIAVMFFTTVFLFSLVAWASIGYWEFALMWSLVFLAGVVIGRFGWYQGGHAE